MAAWTGPRIDNPILSTLLNIREPVDAYPAFRSELRQRAQNNIVRINSTLYRVELSISRGKRCPNICARLTSFASQTRKQKMVTIIHHSPSYGGPKQPNLLHGV